MRQLKRVIAATVFLVVVTTPAYADPISGAITAFLTTAGVGASTAAWIGTALVMSAVSAGLQYIATALRGGQERTPFGLKGSIQVGGVVPRAFPIGISCTEGSAAYPPRTWGQDGKTPNAFFTQVIALSDLPGAELNAVIINGERCTYGDGAPDSNLGYAIPEYTVGGVHYLYVKFYDGTQTAADSWLVSQFGSDPDYPYGSDRVGYGVAYAIVTCRVNQELFSGFPSFKFELLGVPFYDPREDTTVGGSGSQRWDTPSTWTRTYNPLVVAYNVLRGISYSGQWLFGLQTTSAARLPLASWFAAMNVCDAAIATNAGGTEAQYRIGGEVPVDSQPIELLEELFKSCNARPAEIGGIFKVQAGAAPASVLSITDDDIIITESQSFDQFPSLNDTVNGIAARYPEPLEGWGLKDAPARYSSDYEAADGDRRLISSVSYNLVPFAEQVQRLMQSALNEARKFRKHAITLPPECWVLEPGDVISWTSERNGYTDKLFRVVPVDQDNLDIGAALVECDPADYDWDEEADYSPFHTSPAVIVRPTPQDIADWDAEAVTIDGDGGRQKAGIRLSWDDDVDDVDGIQYEVRLASDESAVAKGESDRWDAGAIDITHNILSGTEYEVRGKYRPRSARQTNWSDWISVTTADIRVSAIDIYEGVISRDKLDAALEADIDALETEADTAATTLATHTAAIAAANIAQANADRALRAVIQDAKDISGVLLGLQAIVPELRTAANSAVALARFELNQTFTAGLSAEASARLDLAAVVNGLIGANDTIGLAARITVLETASADYATNKASASSVAALDAQINTPSTGLAAAVATLQSTVAGLDTDEAAAALGQVALAVRSHGLDLEQLGNTLLNILSNIHDLQTGQTATLAFYRSEITTSVQNGISANAEAIGELGVLMVAADSEIRATVTDETSARVTADAALATRASTIEAALVGYLTGTTVAAAITEEATARATADTALTTTTNTLVSKLSGLADTAGSVLAAITAEASTRASADSALSTTTTALLSYLSGLTSSGAVLAAINSEASTRASADSALSSSITTVSSSVGRVSASGYFAVQTQTTPAGADARIALMVSSSANATPTTAAIFLDALSDGTSRVLVKADKFLITDGTNNSSPFEFVGSTLYVKSAVIPNISADLITTGTLNVGVINAGSITTTKLAANAVTQAISDSFSNVSSTFTAHNQTQDLKTSSSITCATTSRVEIEADISATITNPTSSQYVSMFLECVRSDGTAIGTAMVFDVIANANNNSTTGARFAFHWKFIDSSPLSSAVTYKIRWHSNQGASTGTGSYGYTLSISAGGILSCTEFKK